MVMLQQPQAVGAELMAQAVTAEMRDPTLQVVRDSIGATLTTAAEPGWFERVLAEAPEPYRDLIRELAVAPIPQNRLELLEAYSRSVVTSLLDRDLLSLKSELVARMQRIGDPSDPGSRRIQEQLAALESARRSLRAE
jgi:DNA primase